MNTKDLLLKELMQKKGKVLSGEELASICNVSRAAIWKAINSLRKEGFNISASQNSGYILHDDLDFFSKEKLISYLENRFNSKIEFDIECFKQIDSTNTYAKKILSENNSSLEKFHKSIIIAESQTAGKGRLGREFISPYKTGIYFSLIYCPQGGIKNPARLTAFAAVAVCRAVKKLFNLECSIKWINDIFYKGKKVCGILAEGFTNFETFLIEAGIIGVGINLESSDLFSSELKKIAAGILDDSNKKEFGRCELAGEIIYQLIKIYEENSDSVMEEYKSLSFLLGKTVKVFPVINQEEKSYFAEVVDINDEANLIVRTEFNELKTLNSGEVSLKSQSFASDV